MGWFTMTHMGMGGHETPKAYLDAQLTYERRAEGDKPFQGLRVLKSVYSGSAYYAAAERYDEKGARIYVTAIICLVRWNPRAADGYIFGYKDMDETVGPSEATCPRSVLALLSPTLHPFALDWRRRCYRLLALKERRVNDGDLIRFPEPMRFTDGSEHREFRIRREGKKAVLTLTDGRGRFKISGLLERRFEIVREPKVAKTFFPAA
ncbi:hypothetical protein RM533_09300 [Croceicoccus sp. F390]|uniref:DUF6927 domain-containing protein n=1 Tax=Croceicoccus esteveae TaxID=3075597 RepID=A0ABU2ZIE8_9SPHN|nr:hypothetical protein [Croceicoccus sp. F390]MDT0576382.1 hypothetical protein [Croceicoccus sp. F390]